MADDNEGSVNMYFPPPPPPDEEEIQNNKKVAQRNNRKRKKKFARKNTQFKNKRKQNKLAHTMSTWAENFTVAATWQIKHQLAYWKARAKALEYENSVLHDIIRKKNYISSVAAPSTQHEEESESQGEDYEGSEEDDGNEEENFEVSEEFIQFLQANAKYKEDARQERERLNAKASEENSTERLEADPPENENMEEKLKELYGDKWQRIAALEMSLQSQFICESDQEKPMYWPNIPFNFNFG